MYTPSKVVIMGTPLNPLLVRPNVAPASGSDIGMILGASITGETAPDALRLGSRGRLQTRRTHDKRP